MKKVIFSFLAILAILEFSACKKDPVVPTPPTTTTPTYTQYGTPLTAVPHTDDIIMYEVNMRAFSQSGNFQGVIDGLDHIESLGVNVIWLMPIFPIGQVNSVNSPYCVQNYKEVNAEFGDLESFRELVDAAHNRGIAVIIDWVANHTSWDNPWISNTNWYTQDAQGNIISPAGTNWADVADLNYDNTNMRKAMIDAMKYWIYEANIDGIRCDAADMVPADFWESAINQLNAIEGRDLILLAEGSNQSNFDAGFEMNYAWSFQTQLKNIFSQGASASSIFTTDVQEYYSIGENQAKLRFTTNHDIYAWDDTPQSAYASAEGSVAAAVISTYLKGAALIYDGQEVALNRSISFFSKNPINWNTNPEVLAQYKAFMSFYANSEAAKKGTLTKYSAGDVVCFLKEKEAEKVMVAVNVRNDTVAYSVPNAFVNYSAQNALTNESIQLDSVLTLKPFEYLILKL